MIAETPSLKEILRTPALFARCFLKIMDKRDKLIPLVHNPMQQHYLANRTPRDIILKARQIGFSTAIQGEMFRYAVTRPARVLTLMDKAGNTQNMRDMATRFYDNFPEEIEFDDGVMARPVRGNDNATTTTYMETGSKVVMATAGSVNTGRSGSYRFIHGSEVAFWDDAAKVVGGALQAGSPQWVVLESTPNGAQGWFYETCMESLDGNSTWKLHFYRWFDNPEYRLPLDAGERLEYTGDELALIQQHKLTPEQIKWRRSKLREVKHLFKQEYPEDVYSCFLTSGIGYFGDLNAYYTAHLNAMYQEGHRYVAGLDFAQTEDYTVLSVIDATTLQQVELLRVNKRSWADMRRLIREMCKRWNVQMLYAEQNSMGSTNIEALQQEFSTHGIRTSIYSFHTTNSSKQEIINGLYSGLHEGGLRLLSDSAQQREMSIFQASQTPTGTWQLSAPKGEHDDIVIANALAWLAVNKPRRRFETELF